jgi:hypothetical protein
MCNLVDMFNEELRTIRKNPLTFVVGFLVLAVLIGWGEYTFVFKELLNLKDEKIRSLQDKKGEMNQPIPAQASPTGPATTFGDNSPANSGNIGTLNSNHPSTTERK